MPLCRWSQPHRTRVAWKRWRKGVRPFTTPVNTCITVYDNGAYTFEKIDERSGKPKTKVYKGTLSSAELEQLKTMVNDQSFRSISSGPPPDPPDDATRLKEGELVITKVARPDGIQQLTFLKRRYATTSSSGLDKLVSNWEKNEKPLKPFLSWVKDTEKKAQSAAKDGTATSCVSPQGAF